MKATTYRSLANQLETAMVGCSSHRLNLAVEDWIGSKEKRHKSGKVTTQNSENRQLLLKIDKLMGEFQT